ncbi:MAG TPA: RDD family protein [Mycobacteriales bacterium]|nr:RDD family protein [Mycobacteriales bacterium]
MYPDHLIVTGEAVAVDLRLASIGSRALAALIDIVLTTLLQLAVLIPLIVGSSFTNGDSFAALLLLAIVGISLGYPVGFETLWRGRTPGKAIMGLRVVRDDGGPIRFRHALGRGLLGVVLEKPGISSGLLALIPMIFTSRSKRLGDLFAGTIVLQERVPGRIGPAVAMPPALAGWAVGLDLSAVDDWLAMRLRQFLNRAGQLSPEARDGLERQLAAEIVAKVGPSPPGAPAWAVIAAILAERRRRAEAAAAMSAPQSWNEAPKPWPPAQPAENPTPAMTPDQPSQAPESTTGFVLPG